MSRLLLHLIAHVLYTFKMQFLFNSFLQLMHMTDLIYDGFVPCINFNQNNHEEWCLLGCYAMWLL
jgi:hypothetical protein